MKYNWFRKTGWYYVPQSIAGIIATTCTVVFCITVFLAIDRHSHSVSDTLYGIFPFFVSALTVWFWIAFNTSKVEKQQD